MKISKTSNVFTHDTSSGRANDIVDGLSNLSRELSEIKIINKELASDKTKNDDSPYLTDRSSYNPTQVKDTERETEWKKVNLSMEQDLADVDKEVVEQKQKYVQNLKNKLNIL